MSEELLVEVRDRIAWVTLNRPQALNALNDPMRQALIEGFEALEEDDGVRCVVLRGAGEHFMAGGDIKGFHQRLGDGPEALHDHFACGIPRLHRAIAALRRMPKPVLASVQGATAGFGLSLMMAADLAIAAEDAFFTLAYCRIGTSPDGGGSYHLPRIVGVRKAMEIALLGDRFDAATAARLGLVNFLVPRADLAAETERLARRLAEGPTLALAGAKQLINQSLDSDLATQLDAEAESFARCAASADFAEGITAFVEKRQAAFRGA